MPRYYYDMLAGRGLSDADGVELADENAARREGVYRAITLLKCSASGLGYTRTWKIAVRDCAGIVIFDIESSEGVLNKSVATMH